MYNILVVDDEIEIADAIEVYLKNQNYKVFKAHDGIEALSTFTENDIHLVLMDIMMPRMDGMQATMEIRKTSTVPVLFLTAKSEDMDKVMGLNVGADDFITKPFNPMELLARVNSNIRRYTSYAQVESMKQDVITIGGIALNDHSKEVSVDGSMIKITPLEYKILHLLMRNPNRVFSIDEIYESVWRVPAFNPDTVTGHIRRIRE